MSTFETPAVDAAVIRRIDDMLRQALREAAAVLADDVFADAGLAWRATQPFLPLMVLLRSLTDAPQGAPSPFPSAENIESAYVERQPLRLVKEQK